VWASLVLDEELTRAQRSAQAPVTPPAAADPASAATIWPAPEPATKPPPESDWYLHHDDTRTLEIGVAAFMLAGTGTGAMAGAAPYLIIEAGQGVFLRPSVEIGESLAPLNHPPIVHALLLAGRFDTCLRLPGLYTQNRGIQLDMCGGADIGFLNDTNDNVILPYVSLGPSLDLRGELGSLLSAALRGGVGVNATSGTTDGIYQPLVSGRIELALSWKVK
jgi:hypothetical protein